ncbi:hypothetical protein N9X46_00925 [Paracoccaceae bacterium]|nr:hypothetical protein [Paracoccaceae bacterium]
MLILPDQQHKNIYHFGESHSLSFVNSNVLLGNETYYIAPIITFGAKASHFSTSSMNKYKAVSAFNINKLPSNAKMLISLGEIDCRADEGIMLASTKYATPIEEVIKNTVGVLLIGLPTSTIKPNDDKFFISTRVHLGENYRK